MVQLVPFSVVLAFFVTSVAIELTPGPNMTYLALLSAQKGRVAGLFATFGVALGLAIIGLLAAFGFAALVAENLTAYEVLRWTGVLYLVWLAYDCWVDAQKAPDEDNMDLPVWSYFRRGLITNLLNPKAFLFYVTVLPSFTLPEQAYWPQALALTAIYVTAATVVHLAIIAGAGSLTPFFGRPALRKTMGGIFAALLVGVAIWLAFNTAQSG